jgi:hypothetical protein
VLLEGLKSGKLGSLQFIAKGHESFWIGNDVLRESVGRFQDSAIE